MKKPLLVCFAVAQEAKPFRKAIQNHDGVLVLITGMGRANAVTATREFIQRSRPSSVLTCGFAGALVPSLRIADIVYSAEDPFTAAVLDANGARAARFCCSDRMAITATEKAALRTDTGAEVVEMESRHIAEVCHAEDVPCAIVRAISDEASEDLPLDFNQLVTPAMALSPAKLALAIARRPSAIPGLMRLDQNSARAAERLSTVLMACIAQSPSA